MVDAFAASPWPSAAPTLRTDTMAAHHPPSFKVFTAEQVRATPYRKSIPAYEEVHSGTVETDAVGASTLLKWTGIGIVAGLAVLTALIVVLNFSDNRAFATSARSALVGNKAETAAQQPAAPVQAQAPAKVAETKPAVAPKPAVVAPPTAKATTVTKKKR